MDQYIPPLYAVAFALITVFLCFMMRIPFFILGLLSLVLVAYGIQDHMYRFGGDYTLFSAPSFLIQNAPTFIIGIVILLSLGFLLLKFGPTAIQYNQPTYYNYGNPSTSKYYSRSPSRSLPFNNIIL